jgi:hypothetical protein
MRGSGSNINVSTYRKSVVANRRAPLRTNDTIFSINTAGQTGALGTNNTNNTGSLSWFAAENFGSGLAGSTLNIKTTDIGTTTQANRIIANDSFATITTDQLNLTKGGGRSGGAVLSVAATTGELLFRAGDVNIMDAGSTWQSAFAPGFKYTGLMSSSTQTNSGSYFEMSSRWKASAGTSTYAPPQSGWGLGKFGFSADNSTTNTSQVNAGSIQSRATENWTNTATGSKLIFSANRTGAVFNEVAVFDMSPETTTLNSDTQLFRDGAGSSTYLNLDANTARFSVPVTTDITTTTINEGTTYTPAFTVDNNISVQINQLAGGTTVIDLASLTGNGRGGSYNILVFNNTASGTPIQVKNTRINTNNLTTHTIPSGNRIIINAYVVGDYATAQHLNVA